MIFYSVRICSSSSYRVVNICKRAVPTSSGGTCEEMKIEMYDDEPVTYIIGQCPVDNGEAKCVCMGEKDDKALVYDYRSSDNTCRGTGTVVSI